MRLPEIISNKDGFDLVLDSPDSWVYKTKMKDGKLRLEFRMSKNGNPLSIKDVSGVSVNLSSVKEPVGISYVAIEQT